MGNSLKVSIKRLVSYEFQKEVLSYTKMQKSGKILKISWKYEYVINVLTSSQNKRKFNKAT